MPLYIPRGERIRAGEKIDISDVLEELKSMEFTGYIEVAYKTRGEFYLGFIFFLRGEAIIAGVEEVLKKSEYLGKEAFEMILNFKEPVVDVYKLEKEKIILSIEYNPDEAFLKPIELEEEKSEEVESPTLRYGIKAEDLVESVKANVKSYLSKLKNFTGVVNAKSDGKEVIVLLENGEIKGAAYFNTNEVITGNLVINLLDFVGRIDVYSKRPEEIERIVKKNPDIEIVDRSELFKKYKIRPPEEEEIESILKKVLEDEIVEGELKKRARSSLGGA